MIEILLVKDLATPLKGVVLLGGRATEAKSALWAENQIISARDTCGAKKQTEKEKKNS